MPLPQAVLQKIRGKLSEAEKSLAELEDHVTDAQRAGIDQKEAREQMDTLRKQISQMRMVYGA